MTELKPCPCCGGKAVYKDARIYCDTGVYVQCTQCKLKTMYELIDHPIFTENGLDESTRYTRMQAMKMVADVWNRRASDAAT